MIINSAPQNEAILSNVGEIGEFRIRNSAKAFNILSSGLYANKIKAIVRELSCNAVDSHVAAGRADTPFDVHLPNSLEPWFSIRDYGTGLSHEQVTNIYTTYFESTKTASNEFIGALGLGSKSPFSYTDNFTVTAIKDGVKGIYSAFINEAGVPSIAKMMDETTDEPAGVEVKFSVGDRYDFDKFRQEARQVYTYFKLRPVVSGCDNFELRDREYSSENIVPGVHQLSNARHYGSIAIMGNIAYPIEIPRGNEDELFSLLDHSLEMHFEIGELDFQASREGLSYIPQTIESIRKKLEAVNAVLASKIAEEANEFKNMWQRAMFLSKRRENAMWRPAVDKYLVDTKFPLMDLNNGRWTRLKAFKFSLEVLEKKYNISISAFSKGRNQTSTSNINVTRDHVRTGANYKTVPSWEICVDNDVYFVKNDLKIGAAERAKHHWRNQKYEKSGDAPYCATVFVLSPADKTKPAHYDKFLKHLCNPPAECVSNASELLEKPRREATGTSAKNVTILKLVESDRYTYRGNDMVWRDAGKADTFSSAVTYYYLPLSGYTVQSKYGYTSGKELYRDLEHSGVMNDPVIYGVRKSDIEFIKTQANWVNIEDHVAAQIGNLNPDLAKSFALGVLAQYSGLRYNVAVANKISNTNSPYLKFVNGVKEIKPASFDRSSLDKLCTNFNAPRIDVNTVAEAMKQECEALYQRYSMLSSLRDSSYNPPNWDAVAEYINLVDSSKGV